METKIGTGFVGLLTITFVILKALGYLNWSWWLVFSPLWISFLILVLLFIFVIVIAIISAYLD